MIDSDALPSYYRVMREVGKSLDIDLFVFGPETHMTAIVAMALGEPANSVQRRVTKYLHYSILAVHYFHSLKFVCFTF